jgi:hypothetical protein
MGQGIPTGLAGGGWGIQYVPVGGLVSLTGGATQFYGDATVALNTWAFVVIQRAAGTWKLYINGVVQSGSGAANPGANTEAWLCVPDATAPAPAAGFAEDVRMSCAFIFARALSAAEILSIYQAHV